MASKNLVGLQLESYILDRNMTPESLGAKIGLSGPTVRRAMEGDKPLLRSTKWLIARELGEDPATLWPPMPRKRQPGGSRMRQAA